MTHRNSSKPNRPASETMSTAEQRSKKGSEKLNAPFKREEVMFDLREALKASAIHIAVAGPDDDVLKAFLGFTLKDDPTFGTTGIDPSKIRIERFAITQILDRAYDFAFQVGSISNRYTMDDSECLRLVTFRRGSPRFIWEAVRTPMDDEGSPICRTIDTAEARMRLLWELPLTVRQLALLANMGTAAARTSLSKEGIRTTGIRNEDGLAEVSVDIARKWLKGRRGFTPTLEPAPTDAAYTDDIVRLLKANGFEAGLEVIVGGADVSTTAHNANIDPEWLLELATGRQTELDLEALTKLAECLNSDVPAFVGGAVERILRSRSEA